MPLPVFQDQIRPRRAPGFLQMNGTWGKDTSGTKSMSSHLNLFCAAMFGFTKSVTSHRLNVISTRHYMTGSSKRAFFPLAVCRFQAQDDASWYGSPLCIWWRLDWTWQCWSADSDSFPSSFDSTKLYHSSSRIACPYHFGSSAYSVCSAEVLSPSLWTSRSLLDRTSPSPLMLQVKGLQVESLVSCESNPNTFEGDASRLSFATKIIEWQTPLFF